MFATSGDILNIALAIGFIVLVIFLSILIFYLILIARDITKVSEEIEEVVSKFHKTITQPLKAFDFLVLKITPYLENLFESVVASKKKK